MDKKFIGIVVAGVSVVGTVLGIFVDTAEVVKMFKKDDTMTVIQQETPTAVANKNENIDIITTVSTKVSETETVSTETIATVAPTSATTKSSTKLTETSAKTTTKATTKTTTTKIRTEATTETTKKPDNKPYSIANISSVFNEERYFYYQCCAVDEDDNMLYYIDKTTIYQIDLSTKEESVYKDFSDKDIELKRIIYNQFDNNVYCCAEKSFPSAPRMYIIFNIETEEYWENNKFGAECPMFFTERDKIIINSGITHYYEENFPRYYGRIEEISINTGNITESWLSYPDNVDSGSDPFLYDDCYYWVQLYGNYDINHNYKFKVRIIYTLSLGSQDYYYRDIKGVFDGIAYTVHNNDVYIMKENFSIYKVNMEKLCNISSADSKDIFSSESSLTAEDALELYISISDVKQTGKASLGKIKNFMLTASGDVVVYDKQDNMLKLIEKNS